MSVACRALPDRAYQSRGFALWQEMLVARGGQRVVDFGRLRPGTLAHFSQMGVNLDVVALDVSALSGLRVDQDGEPTPERAIAALNVQMPKLTGAGCLHGALCWDIPNFLARQELEHLGDWLAHHGSSGAPLFVTLATREQMPARPAAYQILSADRLSCEVDSESIHAPMYSHNDLKRMWPDFDVVRSFCCRTDARSTCCAATESAPPTILRNL